jgi:hypothetical protein
VVGVGVGSGVVTVVKWGVTVLKLGVGSAVVTVVKWGVVGAGVGSGDGGDGGEVRGGGCGSRECTLESRVQSVEVTVVK